MIIQTLAVGPIQANCTIVGCPDSREALVVDPGGDGPLVLAALAEAGLTAKAILLTHAHVDHVGAVEELRAATEAPVYLHAADRRLYDSVGIQAAMFGLSATQPGAPDEELVDGQKVLFGKGRTIEVLHTPGHSPGGVCFHFLGEGLVVAGDTVFQGSIGRTDLWGGDYDTLIDSIRRKLLVLPGETRVITGHGPDTTVAREMSSNPFLR